MDNIAQNLQKFMEEAGINAGELSRRSGVSAPYISQVRNSVRLKIGYTYLQKLAKALDLTVDELISGVRSKPVETVRIDDPEVRLFFSTYWDTLDEGEQEWIRQTMKIAREKQKKAQLARENDEKGE